MGFIREQSFWIACGYGITMGVLFNYVAALRKSWAAYVVYVYGFIIILLLFATGVFGGAGSASGLGVMVVVIGGVVKAGIVLACNGYAIYFTMDFLLGKMGRFALGDDALTVKKTYDHAEGAEARGDFELATELYRAEIEADPKDREAHRRLAEVLVRAERPQEAMNEFRKVLPLSEDDEQRAATTFRMAEIAEDALGDHSEAERLYRMILQGYPQSRHAPYARTRLDAAASEDSKQV